MCSLNLVAARPHWVLGRTPYLSAIPESDGLMESHATRFRKLPLKVYLVSCLCCSGVLAETAAIRQLAGESAPGTVFRMVSAEEQAKAITSIRGYAPGARVIIAPDPGEAVLTVAVPAHAPVRLRLITRVSTGYDWHPVGGVLPSRLVRGARTRPVAGARETREFELPPLIEGTASHEFVYRRVWMPLSPEDRRFTLTLTVKE